MTIAEAINMAMKASGGRLRSATRHLADLISEHPELHVQVAASLVVMMCEPELQAHREMWAEGQGSNMLEFITSLCAAAQK